jgi:hypothetical protein
LRGRLESFRRNYSALKLVSEFPVGVGFETSAVA